MYTIYWLKSIDGIKLRLKRSVCTAGSVKLEELRREVAESLASRHWGGSLKSSLLLKKENHILYYEGISPQGFRKSRIVKDSYQGYS